MKKKVPMMASAEPPAADAPKLYATTKDPKVTEAAGKTPGNPKAPKAMKTPATESLAPKFIPGYEQCTHASGYKLVPYIGCCGDLASVEADLPG